MKFTSQTFLKESRSYFNFTIIIVKITRTPVKFNEHILVLTHIPLILTIILEIIY
jgi:hypothetical protein